MNTLLLHIFSQIGQAVIEADDGFHSADWVNTASIELSDGKLVIQAEIASACGTCETEWRLGLRTSGSTGMAPEILISATSTNVWIDENMNWLYPVHNTDPIPYPDQTLIELI